MVDLSLSIQKVKFNFDRKQDFSRLTSKMNELEQGTVKIIQSQVLLIADHISLTICRPQKVFDDLGSLLTTRTDRPGRFRQACYCSQGQRLHG